MSLDKTRIAFEYVEGTDAYAVPYQEILASAEGDLPDSLYVLATVDGPGINPEIPTQISYEGARFRVWPATNLQAGRYSGQLKLYACADELCAHAIGGTPKTVDYTVTVHRRIGAPAPEGLKVVSGESLTFMLPVTLPDNATGFTALLGDSSRLKVGTPTATGLPVTIGGPLRSGLYNDYITLACTGTCRQTSGVAITYEVEPPAGGEHGLIVAPNNLTFATTEGDTAASQTVRVDLPTWGGGQRSQLRYTVDSLSPWLKATPTDTGVTVTASAANLKFGNYSGSVYVTEPATGLTQNLYAAITVGLGLVRPADLSVVLNAETSAQALQWQLPVNVNGGPNVGYVASSDQDWIQLPQPQGTTGQTLTVRIDPQALRNQVGDAGKAYGNVVLRPTAAPYSPILFSVNAEVKLPSLGLVAPQVLLADQAQTVRLRGTGLSGVAKLTELLQLDGQPLSNVVRAGDLVTLNLPPLAAGNHELRLNTASGLSLAPLTLRAVTPTPLPYAALEPFGQPSALFYDAWRRALFTLDAAGGTMKRYTWGGWGSRWTVTTHPQAVQALGPALDGDHWLVSSPAGDLSLIHADTFAVQRGPVNWSASTGQGMPPYGEVLNRSNGMAIFRSKETGLLRDTSIGGIDLVAFNLTGSASALRTASQLKTSAIGHQRMLVTADGERALFFQRDGFYGPTLYLSPSPEDTFRQVTGLVEDYTAPNELLTLSANGDRTLTGWSEDERPVSLSVLTLWNRDFTQGNTLQWGGAGQDQLVGAALSPDGRRAYVITHPLFDTLPQQARLYVFDTSTPLLPYQSLPEMGYTELPTLADCAGEACQSDWPRLLVQVSPDGQTLFVAGRRKLLVVPVPAETALATASRTMARAASVRPLARQPVRWR